MTYLPDIDINAQDSSNETALHIACGEGNINIVRFLLETFAETINPKLGNCRGNLPIHIAVMNQHLEITELLLDFDETVVNLPNTLGNTPLHFACWLELEALSVILTLVASSRATAAS